MVFSSCFFRYESVISYEHRQDLSDIKTGYLLVRLKRIHYGETQSHFCISEHEHLSMIRTSMLAALEM